MIEHPRRPSGSDEVPELHLEREVAHARAARTDDRIALGAVLALVCLAVLALVAVNLTGSSAGTGDRRADDPDGARGTDLDEPSSPIEIGVLGPRDGLDSLRLPVSVEPSGELVDGQTVTVRGSEFPPDRELGVVMCSGAVDLGGGAAQCQLSPFTPVTSRGDGTFEVEFDVRRIIWVGGHEIDCAAPTPDGLEATCIVAVGAISDYDQSGIAPVHFDGSVPPPPRPQTVVSAREGLFDGQVVTIEVVDLDADFQGWWWPNLCTSAPELYPSHPDAEFHDDTWCEVPTLPDGSYPMMDAPHDGRIDVRVHRLLNLGAGTDPIDCAEWPGRCWVQVWAGPRPIDPVPLEFDPTHAPTTREQQP
jgi:hypothetical protein